MMPLSNYAVHSSYYGNFFDVTLKCKSVVITIKIDIV